MPALLLVAMPGFSQKKWDGGGGNSNWTNGLNWRGDAAPLPTEDVVLDNSIVTTNYTVLFPAAAAITVRSIVMSPAASRAIELVLPVQNTLVPGLTVTGPGYGLTINSGAVFKNASGATSGNAVRIADSIRINNDGRYIHNTFSGHSANVHVLSAAPGTEKGILELDIPSASSTISLSGKIFGRLVLRSTAAGGTCNYTAAGTGRVMIRNNLEINPGVNLSLNCSDTIFISGNLSQESGTLNLGNSLRSVVMHISQNFVQEAGAVITETGTGIQTIVLGGNNLQLVNARSILNQVALVKTGAGTALFKSPVSLPYKLSLKGGRVGTSQLALITLLSACTIEADTLAGTSFVDGPLKKEGLNNTGFLFPVGTAGRMRWVRLEQATGNFTVQYFRNDPHSISSVIGSGLHHLSTLEYWDVLAAAPGSGAVVKLSFNDPHSGGVTNLSSLRVANLANGTWQNAGNTNYSGNPGANGWVSSIAASGFSANSKSFALASAMGQENPLPLFDVSFSALRRQQTILFEWKLKQADAQSGHFEIQQSEDGKIFSTFQSIQADRSRTSYSYRHLAPYIYKYYRIRMQKDHGAAWYESKPVLLSSVFQEGYRIEGSNLVTSSVHLSVHMETDAALRFIICNSAGVLLKQVWVRVKKGSSLVTIDLSDLKSGWYIVKEASGSIKQEAIRCIKR